MVSDEEIVGRLQTLLKEADLSTATTSSIRQQLEHEFGIELGDRTAFIRHHIDLYLQCHPPQISTSAQNGEGGGDHPQLEAKVEEGGGHVGAKPQEGKSRDFKESTAEESTSTLAEGRKRGRPGGLNKVCGVSPELQAIVGQATMPRTQIVKQLWMYIRANNLQDPSNKRNIICNDALRLVFDTDSTDMFQMNKLLARHIWAIDSADDGSEPNAKKIAYGNTSGLVSPVPISDSLASFLGTIEIEMSHEEVIKHLWDYIRHNKLQDPSDKGKINCDERLQKLFERENFFGFEMENMVAPHFSRGLQFG